MHQPRLRFPGLFRVGLLAGLICATVAVCAPWIPGLASSPQAPQRISLTLLGTTDLHGNIMPVDYYANRPAERGLAKIFTLVRRVRATEPNVLLLDSGDTIQGTPLAYYFARKHTSKPNPTIAVMNAMGYDAMALGNHEFNFGLDVLWKAKREAKFPILAANLRQEYRDKVRFLRPFIIKEVAGVRVGIVGLVTPGVPRWEQPANYRGYRFEPIVEAARRVIPEVRRGADLVVVIAHSGLERNPLTGEPFDPDQMTGENAVYALAEQVPGIDVILFGHSHRELPQALINSVLVVQAKNWGQSLAKVNLEMERDARGAWRVVEKRSTTMPVTPEVAADAEIVKLAEPYHQATEAYLDTPIAACEKELDAVTARYEDHPLVDLIHKVQMAHGHADVSLATMFLTSARIPVGRVTVRQVASLYIYENTLYTVEMTGAQLKEALEHAASFFPAWPLPPGEPLRLPGYNADSAEGVRYTMDLTRSPGQRVRDLSYKGKPLGALTRLRVAINNYRYAGGGHYDVYKGLPIVYRSSQEIRDLLIEFATRTGTIPTTTDNNWKIVPQEALEAILNEARATAATGATRQPSAPRRVPAPVARWRPFRESPSRSAREMN